MNKLFKIVDKLTIGAHYVGRMTFENTWYECWRGVDGVTYALRHKR